MPENQSDDEIVAIAQEIAGYLRAHPHSADSLEGVGKWWLTRQRYEQSIRTVRRALDYLVAEGVVKKSTSVGGEALYSSTERSFGEIC